MEISIEGVGKLRRAKVKIDRIAVIAGVNSSGKSTVGKVLYSIMQGLNGMDEDAILALRCISLRKACQRVIAESQMFYNDSEDFYADYSEIVYVAAKKIERFVKQGLKEGRYVDDVTLSLAVTAALKESLPSDEEKNAPIIQETVQKLLSKIRDYTELPSSLIVRNKITAVFRDIFENQINTLLKDSDDLSKAHVDLKIKNKNIHAVFEKDICVDLKQEIVITSQAVGIDDIHEDLRRLMHEYERSVRDAHLDDGNDETLVASVLRNEKMSEVFDKLGSVISGDFVFTNHSAAIKQDNMVKPLNVANLSDGLKTFAILKALIERKLEERDVLILDEPEVHLHPEWQIRCAELIVLLQKELDLSVVVTTHSPYFVEALNLYSCKYGIEQGVSYYVAKNEESGFASIESVDGDLKKIFQVLVDPIAILTELRLSLGL